MGVVAFHRSGGYEPGWRGEFMSRNPSPAPNNRAATGDDLRDFADRKLFPYLQAFKEKAASGGTIGYNLREICEIIDTLRFRFQSEKHELSHIYEARICNVGNAGRNGGEHYTPRPTIRAMVQVVQPKIGEKIYDGAWGSAASYAKPTTSSRPSPT